MGHCWAIPHVDVSLAHPLKWMDDICRNTELTSGSVGE
jgi:hypothetical protein